MFPGHFGRNTCVPGEAETPATWVIPGGDSAPTKMTTHLGDSRSEAEHHRNSWAELCSVRAESPAPGRSLRPVPQFNHEAWPQVSNGTEPEVLGGTLFHMPRAETPALVAETPPPWNISWGLRAEILV